MSDNKKFYCNVGAKKDNRLEDATKEEIDMIMQIYRDDLENDPPTFYWKGKKHLGRVKTLSYNAKSKPAISSTREAVLEKYFLKFLDHKIGFIIY